MGTIYRGGRMETPQINRTMKEQIDRLESIVVQLNSKLDENTMATTRILFHLEDDPKMNHKGVVSKLGDHEKRIDKLEKGDLANKAKVAGFSAGIGGLAGAGIAKLYTWLSHVLF